MRFRCKKCEVEKGSRSEIREHVRTHGKVVGYAKGGDVKELYERVPERDCEEAQAYHGEPRR